MDDRILFHGSRGGITGEIEPKSRPRCDFGVGFYMGSNDEQAKGLIIEDAHPVLYTVKLHLSEIEENRILRLTGMDWVYTVLACREKVKSFLNTPMAEACLKKLEQADVVIGPIADDRMNEAMRRFEDYGMTDRALEACLQSVDYGEQFVAKTPHACGCIEIVSREDISGQEADDIREYVSAMRVQSRNIVQEMQLKYQREGKYLNELIQEAGG